MPTCTKETFDKFVIDSLCLPVLRMPVYLAENGKRWADGDNVTSLRTFAFELECKGCPLVGVLKFHPTSQHELSYKGK